MTPEAVQYAQTRQVEVTVVYHKNEQAKDPVLVNIGGARSSKSHSIAQLMIKKFNEEKNKNLLTTRKTLPALRTTAYRVAVDLMKDYGSYYYFNHNKSERTIYNPYKNNLWLFTSIAIPEKIKSTEFNYVHMEEANEFNYDDYMILKLRMSGKEERGEHNQMYLSLNPTQKYGWVNEELLPQKDIKVIHSTYEDAIQFLPKSYVKMIEALKKEDPSYWHVYGLGLFAEIKGIIHQLQIIPALPAEPIETIYGLDFGFVNPNALLQIDIDMENMALYLTELLYQT
ncbi:phage terminase large subunit, partial [bacterium]|nr:phage terminase large subunit [bacterium]